MSDVWESRAKFVYSISHAAQMIWPGLQFRNPKAACRKGCRFLLMGRGDASNVEVAGQAAGDANNYRLRIANCR